jgi:NAD(P)-dependent dehydrogenase (short-subunit alcohol dehydrogenase family)
VAIASPSKRLVVFHQIRHHQQQNPTRARMALGTVRPDVQRFYQPVFDLTAEHWRAAIDSQATALLHCAREAVGMMGQGGRIIAVTYAPGGKTGSWRSWAAMGPAKAAMESLLRYLAWDLAGRGITANAVSPGATDDSVFSTLPSEVLEALRDWAGTDGFRWVASRHRPMWVTP